MFLFIYFVATICDMLREFSFPFIQFNFGCHSFTLLPVKQPILDPIITDSLFLFSVIVTSASVALPSHLRSVGAGLAKFSCIYASVKPLSQNCQGQAFCLVRWHPTSYI